MSIHVAKRCIFGAYIQRHTNPSPMSETTKTTAERVIDIIAEKSGEAPGKVTPERMLDDMGFDSLDSVELCMEVEKEFNIALADEEMEKFSNVKSIIDQVEKTLAVQEAAKK